MSLLMIHHSTVKEVNVIMSDKELTTEMRIKNLFNEISELSNLLSHGDITDEKYEDVFSIVEDRVELVSEELDKDKLTWGGDNE